MDAQCQLATDKARYVKIGGGEFWSGSFQLEATQIEQTTLATYIPFDDTDEVIHVIVHDGGDLEGFDHHYNLGSHSSTYFCVCCQIDDKIKFCDTSTVYRTAWSISGNGIRHEQIVKNNVKLPSKQTPLQYSQSKVYLLILILVIQNHTTVSTH